MSSRSTLYRGIAYRLSSYISQTAHHHLSTITDGMYAVDIAAIKLNCGGRGGRTGERMLCVVVVETSNKSADKATNATTASLSTIVPQPISTRRRLHQQYVPISLPSDCNNRMFAAPLCSALADAIVCSRRRLHKTLEYKIQHSQYKEAICIAQKTAALQQNAINGQIEKCIH